jgi:hypothetical protein
MSNEVPLLVEYPFGQGHIRYYLAPKIAVRFSRTPTSPSSEPRTDLLYLSHHTQEE